MPKGERGGKRNRAPLSGDLSLRQSGLAEYDGEIREVIDIVIGGRYDTVIDELRDDWPYRG